MAVNLVINVCRGPDKNGPTPRPWSGKVIQKMLDDQTKPLWSVSPASTRNGNPKRRICRSCQRSLRLCAQEKGLAHGRGYGRLPENRRTRRICPKRNLKRRGCVVIKDGKADIEEVGENDGKPILHKPPRWCPCWGTCAICHGGKEATGVGEPSVCDGGRSSSGWDKTVSHPVLAVIRSLRNWSIWHGLSATLDIWGDILVANQMDKL